LLHRLLARSKKVISYSTFAGPSDRTHKVRDIRRRNPTCFEHNTLSHVKVAIEGHQEPVLPCYCSSSHGHQRLPACRCPFRAAVKGYDPFHAGISFCSGFQHLDNVRSKCSLYCCLKEAPFLYDGNSPPHRPRRHGGVDNQFVLTGNATG
jgi:hypothetical protein